MAVKLMTQAEYGRRRGVSREAVRIALVSGRITGVERDGKTLIDPDVADVQWERNTRKTQGLRQAPMPPASTAGSGESAPDASGVFDIGAARAKREHHEANLAAMREAKESGALLDRALAVKAVTDAAATLSQALERIPGLATELAVESDATKIRSRLGQAVRNALDDAVESMRRMIAEGPVDGRP